MCHDLDLVGLFYEIPCFVVVVLYCIFGLRVDCVVHMRVYLLESKERSDDMRLEMVC